MGANVLVVFYCRDGETEKLALAAGVGAIQMRGGVRLRRLPEIASIEEIEANPVWKETYERMKSDYIAPREIDHQWAEVVILAAPADSIAEMELYLGSIGEALKGKRAAVIGIFGSAAAGAGLNVIPCPEPPTDPERALAYGRLAVAGIAKAGA